MMTNDQVDEAFQALHDAQAQAHLLFMDLRDAGDAAGAASAKLRADRLQNEIDNLISKELGSWQAGAEGLISQLTGLASDAQRAVQTVENDVKIAQSVVNAMQVLDKVIAMAMKFIG